MLKTVTIVITGALLGFMLQVLGNRPVLAQSMENPGGSLLIIGSSTETYEAAFQLPNTTSADGYVSEVAPAECQLSFKVRAIGLTGQKNTIEKEIQLNAGDFKRFLAPFSEFSANGAGHVLIRFSNVKNFGPCVPKLFDRLKGPDEDTRVSYQTYADRARFSEVVLATTPYKSAAESGGRSSKSVLISGSIAEKFEASFYLQEIAIVDGFVVQMAPAGCQVSFKALATDATGKSNFIQENNITLNAGEIDTFEAMFASFAANHSGHILIDFSNVMAIGPCRLLTSGRLVDEQSGRTSGFVQRVPVQILGVENPD